MRIQRQFFFARCQLAPVLAPAQKHGAGHSGSLATVRHAGCVARVARRGRGGGACGAECEWPTSHGRAAGSGRVGLAAAGAAEPGAPRGNITAVIGAGCARAWAAGIKVQVRAAYQSLDVQSEPSGENQQFRLRQSAPSRPVRPPARTPAPGASARATSDARNASSFATRGTRLPTRARRRPAQGCP